MRCEICKYKINEITTYKCQCCNLNLCIKHRYTFSHNCNKDIKNTHKEILKQNNPVVIAEKVIKI